jgi:hypothetical protein
MLSLVGLFGLGCFEACKIFAVIPAAFDSSPMVWSNPMSAQYGDDQPNQSGRDRMTSRQRAQYEAGGSREGR